jgi:hypothetical protein
MIYTFILSVATIFLFFFLLLSAIAIHTTLPITRLLPTTVSLVFVLLVTVAHLTEIGLLPNVQHLYPVLTITIVSFLIYYTLPYHPYLRTFYNLSFLTTWLRTATLKHYLYIVFLATPFIMVVSASFLTYPNSVDEMMYHVPQAVSIFQTGAMRSLSIEYIPHLNYYPQGVATFWAYLMSFTNSLDLLPLSDLIFTTQLAVATTAIAKAQGMTRRGTIILLITMFHMPLLYVLIVTRNADLSNTAAIVSMISVFVSHTHHTSSTKTPTSSANTSVFQVTLFYAHACLSKTPIIATITLLLCMAYLVFSNTFIPYLFRLHYPRTQLISSLIILGQGWVSYIRAALDTGNPFFPVSVKMGPRIILDGPIDIATHLDYVQSHYGILSHLDLPTRWVAATSDWLHNDTNINSAALTGPLVTYVLLFCFLAAVINAVYHRNYQDILLVVIVFFPFVFPNTLMFRYAFSSITIFLVLAVRQLDQIVSTNTSALGAYGVITLISSTPLLVQTPRNLLWIGAQIAPKSLLVDHGYSLGEHIPLHRMFSPTPKMVRAIRSHLNTTTSVTYTIPTYPLLLYHHALANYIQYVPLPSTNRTGLSLAATSEASLIAICSKQTDLLLMEQDTVVDQFITNHQNVCPFRQVYSDSLLYSDSSEGRFMTLYSRAYK